MAVVGIAEERMGSPGPLRQSRDGFSIERVFQVRVNSHADDAPVVNLAVGLPQLGNIYQTQTTTHPYLFCVEREIERLSPKSLTWLVRCRYETPKPSENNNQNENYENPEFELPVIRVSSTTELRDVVKTVETPTPKPIVNKANDPFRPHPKKEVFFPTLMIQRNEAITTPLGQTQLAYLGKLNSDTFWGLTAGKWRCVRIDGEITSRVLPNGVQIPYVIATYEFHARDTWALEILNAGWNYLDGSGNKRAFMTKDGREYEGFLDADGEETATPEFLEFDIYEEVAFAGLHLPQSFLDAVP
jgi:hypothetical protein